MFTKQHYMKVGDILAKHKASLDLIRDFADMFEIDNNLFDREKFIDYIRRNMTR